MWWLYACIHTTQHKSRSIYPFLFALLLSLSIVRHAVTPQMVSPTWLQPVQPQWVSPNRAQWEQPSWAQWMQMNELNCRVLSQLQWMQMCLLTLLSQSTRFSKSLFITGSRCNCETAWRSRPSSFAFPALLLITVLSEPIFIQSSTATCDVPS